MRRLFVLLLLALAPPVSAQEILLRHVADPETDTHVEVLALFSTPSPGGHFPVRVKIANQLDTDRSVRLAFDCESGGEMTTSSSSFSFNAPAGRTSTHDILVPLAPPGASHYIRPHVRMSLGGSIGSGSASAFTEYDRSQPAVLLSEALFTPNASALDSASTGRHPGSRYSASFASRFDPKQLPDNWLAYSGYDSILMLDSDWSHIHPGGRNAILSRVRLGGQLLIYTHTGADAKSLDLPADPGFGRIDISPIPATLALNPSQTVDQVLRAHPGGPYHSSLRSNFDSGWPLKNLFGRRDFRYGLFIVVLIAFGVVVGPVNLFVFAKSGQRHKLFITTPLISLGASGLLVALIILQDGFGGTGVRRIHMEVRADENINAAFVHQEQFSRTGVLTSSRFIIDPASAFSPVPIEASRWARYTNRGQNRGSFNLQPADGKLSASGDWFQSRSEHGHALASVIPTRGRIETAAEPGTYISTFAFPIEILYYLDDADLWHRADQIASGARFTLTPVASDVAEPYLLAEANGFTERNRRFLERAAGRRGHFVAITTHAPGIDTHPGIRWKETRTVITGPIHTP